MSRTFHHKTPIPEINPSGKTNSRHGSRRSSPGSPFPTWKTPSGPNLTPTPTSSSFYFLFSSLSFLSMFSFCSASLLRYVRKRYVSFLALLCQRPNQALLMAAFGFLNFAIGFGLGTSRPLDLMLGVQRLVFWLEKGLSAGLSGEEMRETRE